jgi:hypothetical protein
MLWPGMPLRVGSCDLRRLIARNRGQARVPFAIHACATCQGRGTSLDKRGYDDPLSQFQEFFVRQTAQQRADVREDFLARRRIGLGEVIDEFAEGDLAGAAFDDLGRDRVGLEDPLPEWHRARA